MAISGQSGFIRGEVESVICRYKDPSDCCPGTGVSLWFCQSICVLCCLQCDIKFKSGDAEAEPTPLQNRSYPTVTQIFGGQGFTTSEYGRFLPIVFGADKLLGNVFWYSGFDEKTTTIGGEIYSYTTVSFALGISEGEINGVLRMWLGDKVLMDNTQDVDVNNEAVPGADGFIAGNVVNLIDSDSPLAALPDDEKNTIISVFNGSGTQLPEGIIVDKEGYASTPAYRGVAYVLFENFVITDGTIPNISVEITANTQNLYPRVYGELPIPQTYFDTTFGDQVVYDPSYQLVHLAARDGSGSGTVPNGTGFSTFNANTLEHISSFEFKTTYGIDWTDDAIWLTSSGMILVIDPETTGKAAWNILNPFSGTVDATLASAGSAISPDPFAGRDIQKTSLIIGAKGRSGRPIDIMAGMLKSGGGGVTFSEIDNYTSNITVVAHVQNVFNSTDIALPVNIPVLSGGPVTTTSFPDGSKVEGHHVFIFHHSSASVTDVLNVSRITIDGDTQTIDEPSLVALTGISADEFGGVGYAFSLEKTAVDPNDSNIILFIRHSNNNDRADYIVKWNPFTEQVVWSTACPDGESVVPSVFSSGEMGVLVDSKVGFWDAGLTGPIWTVDLNTGVLTSEIDDILPQNLPTPRSYVAGHGFYYHGLENSITYTSSAANQDVIKVFLGKITRQTVELSDIVKILLARVGYNITDLEISDLAAITLHGYTVTRISSLRTIFSELGQAFKFDVIESDGRIKYTARGGSATKIISEKDLADIDENGWFKENQENEFARSRKISLTYKDLDREYAKNVQSVYLPDITDTQFDDDAAIDVTVPIVLKADEAKKLAEILLYSKSVYNTTYQGHLGPKYLDIDPGDIITFNLADSYSTTVRMRETSIGNDKTVKWTGTEEDSTIYSDTVNLFGAIGRFETGTVPAYDSRIDPFLLAIPFRSDAEAQETSNQYLLFLTFLNNSTSAIISNDLTVVLDGTESFTVSPPAESATWGYVSSKLGSSSFVYGTDFDSSLVVQTMNINTNAPLVSKTPLELVNDPTLNLAYVGGELIQFETVVDNGNGNYTLSGLNRARYGTDQFYSTHSVGERFVLLDPNSVLRITVPVGSSPRRAIQVFTNSNNPFQPPFINYWVGFNLRPFSVSSLDAVYSGDDAVVTWIRRTRHSGEWLDGIGTVPLNEVTESYEIYYFTDPTLFSPYDPTGYMRKKELTLPTDTYTLAEQTADGFVNTTTELYYFVLQSGSNTGNDPGLGLLKSLASK